MHELPRPVRLTEKSIHAEGAMPYTHAAWRRGCVSVVAMSLLVVLLLCGVGYGGLITGTLPFPAPVQPIVFGPFWIGNWCDYPSLYPVGLSSFCPRGEASLALIRLGADTAFGIRCEFPSTPSRRCFVTLRPRSY